MSFDYTCSHCGEDTSSTEMLTACPECGNEDEFILWDEETELETELEPNFDFEFESDDNDD